MKAKKILSAVTAITLLPAAGAITGAPAVVPTAEAAQTSAITVRLNPAEQSPFNNGEFEGWGTSLCWWANRLGYSEKLTQQAADAFFSEDGLGLDIARYNIGGGDDPDHNHVTRSDSKVPGVWDNSVYTNDGHDVTITYDTDMTKDANQLNIAKAALEANPALYFEGFSNSAPYFMTNSGCSSGAADPATNNLRDDMYDDFAKYIANATQILKDNGITFKSYSPMNEPDTNYWGANSPKQEGCHFDPGTSQSTMITETRKALDEAGLKDVLVAGMDETSIDSTVKNLDKLTPEAKEALGRIDTHTYSGSNRSGLKAKAQEMGKTLWMSEVDGGWDGFGLADRIILDMNGMMPAAWVMWDIVDVHKDSDFTDPSGNKTEANNSVSETGSLWGVGMADHDNEKLVLTNKYYAFGQFTKYINPGDTIIASSNSTLAAYNKETGDIKIVATNSSSADKNYVFDLSAFTNPGTTVQEIRTSDSGEKWADVSGEATLSDKKISSTLKARSVTTYIVKGNGSTDYAFISGGGDQIGIGDSITLTVLSNLADADNVEWSVSDDTKATITSDGVLTAKDSGEVTVYAKIGNFTTSRTFEIPLYTITGTPSWSSAGAAPPDSTDYTKAADGDFNTYFGGTTGGWVMYDYGSAFVPEKILLAARSGNGMPERMIGGKVQGSNDGITWTDIYKVTSALPSGQYTEIPSSEFLTDTAYRYFRYTNPDTSANIAEFAIEGTPATEKPANEPYIDDLEEFTDNFESGTNIFNAPEGDFSTDGNQVFSSTLDRYKHVFAPVKATAVSTLPAPITLGKNQRFRLTFTMFAGWEDKGKENSISVKDSKGNIVAGLVLSGGGYNLYKVIAGGEDLLANVSDKPVSQCQSTPAKGANRWGHASQPYVNNVGYNKTVEIVADGTGTLNISVTGGAADATYTTVIDTPIEISSLELVGDYYYASSTTVSYDNLNGDIITYPENLPEPEEPEGPTEAPVIPDNGELINMNFDNSDLTSSSSYGKASGTPSYVDDNGGKVVSFDGTSASQITLTDANGNSLLTGQDTITMSFKVKPVSTNASWMFFAAPNSSTQEYLKENYLGIRTENGNLYIERYKNNGVRSDVASAPVNMNNWNDILIFINENNTTLYVNGTFAASVASDVTLSDILGNTSVAYIGRANWNAGEFASGYMDDFVIYNYSFMPDFDSLDLGDLSNVTEDLTLPSDINGTPITWSTSDENVIKADGTVVKNKETKTAVLTASSTVNGLVFKKDFTVTVPGLGAALETFTAYAENNTISFTSGYSDDSPYDMFVAVHDTDGNLVAVSMNTASGTFENIADGRYTVTCYLWDENQSSVTTPVTKTVNVKPEQEMSAYLFAHFVGNESNASHEQIYFSVSQDGQTWTTLNNKQPVLVSDVGEKGVRDPYILRGEDGKFFIIATDLSIYNRRDDPNRWGTCQTSGSKSIVVWESTDLVNWSQARIIEVAADNAGCTWAPEAVYDPEKDMYMVFWASKVSDDNYSTQRIYRSYTKDFVTFTEPEIYMADTVSNIDTTIIDYKGVYYRFTKNESQSSIIMEKSTSLSGDWTDVETYNLGSMTGYEGPAIYKINGENEWCLLLDYYSKSQGYKPFVTDDITKGVFTQGSDFTFDDKYRHGTVMPITQAEYDALIEAYGTAE